MKDDDKNVEKSLKNNQIVEIYLDEEHLKRYSNAELVNYWAASEAQFLKSKNAYKFANVASVVADVITCLGTVLVFCNPFNALTSLIGLGMQIAGLSASGIASKITKKRKEEIDNYDEISQSIEGELEKRMGVGIVDEKLIFPDVFGEVDVEYSKNRLEIEILIEKVQEIYGI